MMMAASRIVAMDIFSGQGWDPLGGRDAKNLW